MHQLEKIIITEQIGRKGSMRIIHIKLTGGSPVVNRK